MSFKDDLWGQPTWPWIISGGLALLAQVSCGLSIGFLWPTFMAPAATAILFFTINGALVLLPGLHNQNLLSGGFTQVQQVAFRVNDSVLWSQALWFAGATVLGLAFCALRLPVSLRKLVITASTGSFLALTGLIQIVGSQSGFFIYEHSGWNYTCAGSPSICLHPAYATRKQEIASAISPTVNHLQGTTFSSTRYEWTNRGLLGEPSNGSIAFHLDRFDADWQARLRSELARDLLTAGSAVGGPCDRMDAGREQGAFVGLKSIVVAWLADSDNAAITFGKDEVSAADRFRRMPEAQKKLWLSRNAVKICSSRLSPSDF